MNRRNYKKINSIVLSILLVIFFVFVVLFEIHNHKTDNLELQEQARIIAGSLWNLDSRDSIPYLELAARLNNYEQLTVLTNDGHIFVKVKGAKHGIFDRLLSKAGLILPIKLQAEISYHNKIIGRIEAIHHHSTIYLYLYLLLVMALILLISKYFVHTLQDRDTLEIRVLARTRELQKANQHIQTEKERYREIYNAPSEAIFIHDAANGEIHDVNQGMLEMFGYSYEEALQVNVGELSSGKPPYTQAKAQEKVTLAVSQGPQTFEWRSRKKDGTVFWAEVVLKHTKFSGKYYVLAVVRDIDKRKQAEASLYFTKSAIDRSSDSAFWSRRDGRFIYANESACRALGYSRQELLTMTVSDIDPNFPPGAWADHWQDLKEKGAIRVETCHRTRDGNIFPVEVLATFMEYEGEEFNCSIVRDITERKEAEKNLAAEKERLAVTLRSIGDGVITTDIAGNIVFLNKVAESLTGWENRAAAGRPLSEVFHIINEQSRKICENPAAKVINCGQIIGLANHTVLIAKDGQERSIADSGAPILDSEGNIIGVVLVFRDVTEQIKTDREILKIKKLESVGVLAGGIAHDFNNILAAILGNINLALFNKNLDDRTRKLLSSAEKASIRAKDLTRQLLTFAKGGEPVKETSSLENVIKDSADFVLRGDTTACDYDIPEDLWLVDIDRGQMSQVIQNIVINAGHAMPDGGKIRIKCENISATQNRAQLPFTAAGDFVKISIKDNGCGIPADLLEKIFDPYFSTKPKGSGLGLAISQSIINKHNGHISAVSTPGAGSVFSIYLPSTGKPARPEQQTAATSAAASTQSRVLIMDDEEMVRTVAQAMLTNLGHEVVLSASGDEAIELYQEGVTVSRPFDLVIMDLTIPGGMGGKEAVQEVLKIDPAARVIVSSGYSNDPIMASFKDYGFCAKIEKPYQLHELSAAINQAMASGHQHHINKTGVSNKCHTIV